MRGYVIKVWPVVEEDAWRVVEANDRQNLHHLHHLIRTEYGLQGEHLYSFYMGGEPYEAKRAYGCPRADTPHVAGRTSLGSLGLKKGRRFAYVFDFSQERVFGLLVQSVRNNAEDLKLPRVVTRHGPQVTPASDPAPEGLGDLEPFVGDVRSVAASTAAGKRFSRTVLQTQHALAVKLADAIGGDPARFHLLEKRCGEDVSGWIVSLPESLAAEGLFDEALDVIARYEPLEPEALAGDRALILLHAGQRQEAMAAAEANIQRFPDDAWVRTKSGDVCWKAGEPARAERLYRKALELAGSANYLREALLERLLSLLEEQGMSQAAKELAEQESRRRSRGDR